MRIMKETEIPVFLFTGFLDSGKTTFIQGTLEDERFNDGTPILVILCEDGEEELDFSAIPTTALLRSLLTTNSSLLPTASRRRGAERRLTA